MASKVWEHVDMTDGCVLYMRIHNFAGYHRLVNHIWVPIAEVILYRTAVVVMSTTLSYPKDGSSSEVAPVC